MEYNIISHISEEKHQELLNLIHASFEEHISKGILFTCYSYSIDDISNKVLKGHYYIAVSKSNELLGITSFSIKHNNTAYENITAISPKAKGYGIATALWMKRKSYLKSKGIKFILSDTAVDAKSSVNWHINKCGCHILGYESYMSTNYYSYVFREDIEDRGWIVNNIIYPLKFMFSYVKCRLKRKKNGNPTLLHNIYMLLKEYFK